MVLHATSRKDQQERNHQKEKGKKKGSTDKARYCEEGNGMI